MNKNIGSSIRSLRKQRKMTLEQVANKTGLSISFLSQVELSKSSVTLTSLRKIADALNVNISYFFEEDVDHENIKRKSSRKEQVFTDASFSFTDLTGDMDHPHFEPLIATLHPGDNNRMPYSHKGQEFIYILDGTLTVILNDDEFLLYPGDSLHIDSQTPHVWFNDTQEPVRLLVVNAFIQDDCEKLRSLPRQLPQDNSSPK